MIATASAAVSAVESAQLADAVKVGRVVSIAYAWLTNKY